MKNSNSPWILDSQWWDFFSRHSLSVHIGKTIDSDYFCCLERFGSSGDIRDGCALCGVSGHGSTPAAAFEDMIRVYSGQSLEFSHWDEKEYKPYILQFPIVVVVQ